MGDNKKLINLHEQKFNELENFKSNIHMFQENTGASLKNLETQVGQLALNMQNQNKGAFPSDTQKNPKDCMEIQLRSGKEVRKSSRKKRRKRSMKKKKKLEEKTRRICQKRQQMQKSKR